MSSDNDRRILNNKLQSLEQAFIFPDGLPSRPFFKRVIKLYQQFMSKAVIKKQITSRGGSTHLHVCYIQIFKYVTVFAKSRLVSTKTEFSFITAAYRYTQYLSIPQCSKC